MSLVEVWRSAKLGRNARLEAVNQVVDWEPVDRVVGDLRASRLGRPAFPPRLMFKALLLQQWYGLSDVGLEEALNDRLSFRAFVGLDSAADAPDATTISRFRTALGRRAATALAELDGQFAARGLVVKRGTIVDATLVAADAAKPGGPSSSDPDANWTRRGKHSHFGYKAHVAVDSDSGLVRAAELTPAKTAEVERLSPLVKGDERIVYADRAYDSLANRRLLGRAGVANGIMARGNKHRALPARLAAHNRRVAPIRARIEKLFGVLKRSYGYRRVRYRGLGRNGVQLHLLCIAVNLRRAVALTA